MERQQEPLQYPHMGYCSNPRGKWQQDSLPTAVVSGGGSSLPYRELQ
jgi:hypothetical protein